MPEIREARGNECALLSDLALRSKAHWPYTEAQLAVFRKELTLSPETVVTQRAHVWVDQGQLLGFYTLLPLERRTLELQHLFVEPTRLGQGIGRALFRHAAEMARALAFERLVIQSDPHAAGFYRSMGATHERDVASSIPGRFIPVFVLDLASR